MPLPRPLLHRLRIGPQALPLLSGVPLPPFQPRISRRMPLLWAVDAVEADTVSLVIVQDL
ncbi:MAG: hypothetical protein ABIQ24_01870 [Nitrospiraceae bacterium]